MLNTWLTDDTIQIRERVDSWQEAVKLSAQPLLQKGIITPDYLAAIYQQHEKLGPYYVLAPGIAMPHARPEEGAKSLGLSLLSVKQDVLFYSADNDPVNLIVMLSAPDSHSHIELISHLAEFFSDDDAVKKIHQANTIEEIKTIIEKY